MTFATSVAEISRHIRSVLYEYGSRSAVCERIRNEASGRNHESIVRGLLEDHYGAFKLAAILRGLGWRAELPEEPDSWVENRSPGIVETRRFDHAAIEHRDGTGLISLRVPKSDLVVSGALASQTQELILAEIPEEVLKRGGRGFVTDGESYAAFEIPFDGGGDIRLLGFSGSDAGLFGGEGRVLEELHRQRVLDSARPLTPSEVNGALDCSLLSVAVHGLRVRTVPTLDLDDTELPVVRVQPMVLLGTTTGSWIRVEPEERPVGNFVLPYQPDQLEKHVRAVSELGRQTLVDVQVTADRALHLWSLMDVYRARRAQGGPEPTWRIGQDIYILTGTRQHFLHSSPLRKDCDYHEWGLCKAAGKAATVERPEMPSFSPLRVFRGGHPFHCSLRDVLDEKTVRDQDSLAQQPICKVREIEGFICCRSCTYQEVCTKQASFTLPCSRKPVANELEGFADRLEGLSAEERTLIGLVFGRFDGEWPRTEVVARDLHQRQMSLQAALSRIGYLVHGKGDEHDHPVTRLTIHGLAFVENDQATHDGDLLCSILRRLAASRANGERREWSIGELADELHVSLAERPRLLSLLMHCQVPGIHLQDSETIRASEHVMTYGHVADLADLMSTHWASGLPPDAFGGPGSAKPAAVEPVPVEEEDSQETTESVETRVQDVPNVHDVYNRLCETGQWPRLSSVPARYQNRIFRRLCALHPDIEEGRLRIADGEVQLTPDGLELLASDGHKFARDDIERLRAVLARTAAQAGEGPHPLATVVDSAAGSETKRLLMLLAAFGLLDTHGKDFSTDTCTISCVPRMRPELTSLLEEVAEARSFQRLRAHYMGFWGFKVFWLALFTLVPLALPLKLESLDMVLAPSAVFYALYHTVGILIFAFFRAEKPDFSRLAKAHTSIARPLGVIVGILLMLTLMATVQFSFGDSKSSRLRLPSFVSNFVGVHRASREVPKSAIESMKKRLLDDCYAQPPSDDIDVAAVFYSSSLKSVVHNGPAAHASCIDTVVGVELRKLRLDDGTIRFTIPTKRD